MNAVEREEMMAHAIFAAWAARECSVFDLLADRATWTVSGPTLGAGEWCSRQAGEMGTSGVPPVIGTAIFNAIRKPLRSLPDRIIGASRDA